MFTSTVIYYSPTKNTVEFTQLFYIIKSARTYFTTEKICSVVHRTYANRYAQRGNFWKFNCCYWFVFDKWVKERIVLNIPCFAKRYIIKGSLEMGFPLVAVGSNECKVLWFALVWTGPRLERIWIPIVDVVTILLYIPTINTAEFTSLFCYHICLDRFHY